MYFMVCVIITYLINKDQNSTDTMEAIW
jgi:hypothetical protein